MDTVSNLDATPIPKVPEVVFVAIPALNEEHHIEPCIRSLLDGDPRLKQVLIVVADGGSTDRTREIVARLGEEFPNVSLIDNPGKLQASGVNRAVELKSQPHHKVMVRCDAHAVYPPNYIFDVAWQLIDRKVQGLATTMDAKGSTCFSKAAAWIVDTPLGSGGSGHRGGTKSGYVPHGHHAGFDLDWYRELGGYVSSFTPNEDAEYDYRLTSSGGKIWLASELRLDYTMRASIRALWKQYWKYGGGRARTITTHKMRPQFRQMAPVANVALLAFSLLLVFVSPLGLLWPLAYFALILGASVFITITKQSLCGLWAGPALAAMHLAWGLGFVSQLFKQNPRS